MGERICSVDDCERKHFGRGMCELHYRRWVARGTTDPRYRPTPTERLAAGLERKANGCLEWTGLTNEHGYGTINVKGKMTLTHRLAWESTNGPILDGMCVCHHCDNPPCADVSHLFLGTPDENVADKMTKGRYNNGYATRTHCKQGHLIDEVNTHLNKLGYRTCRVCGRARRARYLQRKKESLKWV